MSSGGGFLLRVYEFFMQTWPVHHIFSDRNGAKSEFHSPLKGCKCEGQASRRFRALYSVAFVDLKLFKVNDSVILVTRSIVCYDFRKCLSITFMKLWCVSGKFNGFQYYDFHEGQPLLSGFFYTHPPYSPELFLFFITRKLHFYWAYLSIL